MIYVMLCYIVGYYTIYLLHTYCIDIHMPGQGGGRHGDAPRGGAAAEVEGLVP